MKQTYVQFTAGRGPVECAVACEKIISIFTKTLDKDKINYRMVDIEEDNDSGYRSIVFKIVDDNLDDLKKAWNGTIKFISTKNSFRPSHKRKNWFVGCNFFELSDDKITFDMRDVKVDYMRSSGPGGQNVNKVESGVRLTHLPTGINVKCTVSRDQQQNLKLAKELMQAKLNALNNLKEANKKNAFWLSHDSLERGGEIMIIKGEL